MTLCCIIYHVTSSLEPSLCSLFPWVFELPGRRDKKFLQGFFSIGGFWEAPCCGPTNNHYFRKSPKSSERSPRSYPTAHNQNESHRDQGAEPTVVWHGDAELASPARTMHVAKSGTAPWHTALITRCWKGPQYIRDFPKLPAACPVLPYMPAKDTSHPHEWVNPSLLLPAPPVVSLATGPAAEPSKPAVAGPVSFQRRVTHSGPQAD